MRDLEPVYEMGDEVVDWVHRMIDYNVSGGKMNRGLAVMAVHKIFVKNNGSNFSNKVYADYLMNSPLVNFHIIII